MTGKNCSSTDPFQNYFYKGSDRSEEKQCIYFKGLCHVNQNTGVCFTWHLNRSKWRKVHWFVVQNVCLCPLPFPLKVRMFAHIKSKIILTVPEDGDLSLKHVGRLIMYNVWTYVYVVYTYYMKHSPSWEANRFAVS